MKSHALGIHPGQWDFKELEARWFEYVSLCLSLSLSLSLFLYLYSLFAFHSSLLLFSHTLSLNSSPFVLSLYLSLSIPSLSLSLSISILSLYISLSFPPSFFFIFFCFASFFILSLVNSDCIGAKTHRKYPRNEQLYSLRRLEEQQLRDTNPRNTTSVWHRSFLQDAWKCSALNGLV